MTASPLRPFDWGLRTDVYRLFVDTTRAPTTPELAHDTQMSEDDVHDSLHRLEAHHHLTLAPGSSNIWMAHPFSAVATEFPVDTERGRYWANCAWDMFAIPAMLGLDSRTPTRCAETGVGVELGVKDGKPLNPAGVVHFAVRPSAFWDNVGFT